MNCIGMNFWTTYITRYSHNTQTVSFGLVSQQPFWSNIHNLTYNSWIMLIPAYSWSCWVLTAKCSSISRKISCSPIIFSWRKTRSTLRIPQLSFTDNTSRRAKLKRIWWKQQHMVKQNLHVTSQPRKSTRKSAIKPYSQ